MSLAVIAIPDDANFTGWGDEPSVSFEDDSVFHALEPYFKKFPATASIDQYDGGTLQVACLKQFICLLENIMTDTLAKEDKWIVRKDSWTQGGRDYSKEFIAEKKCVLHVIVQLIQLAEQALAAGDKLVFIGD